MELFVIRRRNVSKTPQDLEAVAAKSRSVGDNEMSHKVRWIRSYVVKEADGTLGTVCIYQAVSPQAIREHAQRVGMPADEIVPVATTVIVREDPRELEQAA
jgi:thiamine biosynthesis protein ThiC